MYQVRSTCSWSPLFVYVPLLKGSVARRASEIDELSFSASMFLEDEVAAMSMPREIEKKSKRLILSYGNGDAPLALLTVGVCV